VRRPATPASTVANPQVANKALTISCDATPELPNGVILAQGGKEQGYALWLREGKLVFTVRVNGKPTSIEAPLASGHVVITARLNHDASMELDIDGKTAAKGRAAGRIPVQPKDTLSIGEDDKTPVGEYESPNQLRGKVENVRVVAD
jgi:hypothetical protein